MENLSQILEKNSVTKESDCNTCPNCKEPVQKIVYLEGFNKYIKVPVLCECGKKELRQKEVEDANKERQLRLKQVITNSLMDTKFKNCRFENWDHQKASERMFKIGMKYAQNFQQLKNESVGLMFYGHPGNGKTFLSNCIANYLLDKLIPVISVSSVGLLDRLKSTYNSNGREGEETIIRSLSNADLLIIDDLGAEQNNDWSISKIYNIIDNRYRNALPLIVTTNLSLEKLKDIYNVRTYDRLLEMCTPILNEAKSLRIDKSKEKTALLKELLR